MYHDARGGSRVLFSVVGASSNYTVSYLEALGILSDNVSGCSLKIEEGKNVY